MHINTGGIIKRTIQIVLLCFLLLSLTYLGACIYANVKAMHVNDYNIPQVENAQYSIKVVNTGLKYYSNNIIDDKQTVTMSGYWELVNDKYEYTDEQSPPLDRGIFGPIIVKDRTHG